MNTQTTTSSELGSSSKELYLSRKYSVDLSGHISVCEMNYRKLVSLLPGLREGTDDWMFCAGRNGNDDEPMHFDVTIKVVDAAPYTTTLSVEQRHCSINAPKILVRLYHDADVAEIISWDGHRNWRPQYEYPNTSMYQPDEKLALNRFLSDWLTFCHQNGFVTSEKCDEILFSAK